MKRAPGLGSVSVGLPASSLGLLSSRAMSNVISICHRPMLVIDEVELLNCEDKLCCQSSCVNSPSDCGPLQILPVLLLGRIRVCRQSDQSRPWSVWGGSVLGWRGAQTLAMLCAERI